MSKKPVDISVKCSNCGGQLIPVVVNKNHPTGRISAKMRCVRCNYLQSVETKATKN